MKITIRGRKMVTETMLRTTENLCQTILADYLVDGKYKVEIGFININRRGVGGFCRPPNAKGVIAVRVDKRFSQAATISRILAHELVHARQFLEGSLEYRNGKTYWLGEPQQGASLRNLAAYMNLPWEREAQAFETYGVEEYVATFIAGGMKP
jgi:hypothetical protein